MLGVQIIQKKMNVVWPFEQGKCVIHITTIEHRLEMNWAVLQPDLFMVAQEDIGQGRPQGEPIATPSTWV